MISMLWILWFAFIASITSIVAAAEELQFVPSHCKQFLVITWFDSCKPLLHVTLRIPLIIIASSLLQVNFIYKKIVFVKTHPTSSSFFAKQDRKLK